MFFSFSLFLSPSSPEMMSMGKTNCLLFSLSFLTLLLSSPTACRADDNDTPGVWDFSQDRYLYLASSIPECGLDCVLELAPRINASCSETDSSERCVCIDETTQYLDVLSCAREQCTIEDSISEHVFPVRRLSPADGDSGCAGGLGGMRWPPALQAASNFWVSGDRNTRPALRALPAVHFVVANAWARFGRLHHACRRGMVAILP